MFIIGKNVKIGFKNSESPYYFLSSRARKFKNIAQIEQRRLFLFTFLVSFFNGRSHAKTDLHNKHTVELCVWLIF